MALPTRGMLNPALVLVEQLNAERLALGRTAVATQSMDLLMTSTSGININISGARQVISHGEHRRVWIHTTSTFSFFLFCASLGKRLRCGLGFAQACVVEALFIRTIIGPRR